MAAECEINNCGVTAVGRCATCGRAMCTSHRQPSSINECLECQFVRHKAHSDSFFAAQERKLQAQRQVQEIVGRLVEAGFPPDCFLRKGTRFKDRWHGGWKQVRDHSSDVYGWFVGEYKWQERTVSDTAVEMSVRTYVTNHGGITREGGTAMSSEDELVSGGYEFWEEICSKMTTIARQHGIAIQ